MDNVCNNMTKDTCNIDAQCVWTDNRCKLQLTKERYDWYINKIATEIIRNDIRRDEILYDQISMVIDKNKYQAREEQVVCKLPLYISSNKKKNKRQVYSQYCRTFR